MVQKTWREVSEVKVIKCLNINDKNYIYVLILVDFMLVKKAYLLSYKKPLFARVNWTEGILRYKA